MPVLPNRNLKKYSSLSTESPDQVPKTRVAHTVSAPEPGNRIVNAFLNFRRRSEENKSDPSELSDSSESEARVESSRMMPSPKKLTSSQEDSERPHLTPYFQKKNNSKKELTSSYEEPKSPSGKDELSKRPTLNPFFNVNHHFMKALRRMGSKDSFSRLKPGLDD